MRQPDRECAAVGRSTFRDGEFFTAGVEVMRDPSSGCIADASVLYRLA